MGIVSILLSIYTIIEAILYLNRTIDNLGYCMIGMVFCCVINSINCTILVLNLKNKKNNKLKFFYKSSYQVSYILDYQSFMWFCKSYFICCSKKIASKIAFISFLADGILITLTSIFRNRISVLGIFVFIFYYTSRLLFIL